MVFRQTIKRLLLVVSLNWQNSTHKCTLIWERQSKVKKKKKQGGIIKERGEIFPVTDLLQATVYFLLKFFRFLEIILCAEESN